jgi:hypothetical protein
MTASLLLGAVVVVVGVVLAFKLLKSLIKAAFTGLLLAVLVWGYLYFARGGAW